MEKIYRTYTKDKEFYDNDRFNSIKNIPGLNKPSGGLWASPIKTEFGWADFCKAEKFDRFDKKSYFDFKIKDGAKILEIHTLREYRNIPMQKSNSDCGTIVPDFEKIQSNGYDGMELFFLEFERSKRSEGLIFSNELCGWDCDSIIIFNKDVITPIRKFGNKLIDMVTKVFRLNSGIRNMKRIK